MFNNLPKQNEIMQFHSGDGKRKFFEALPQEFTWKETTEISPKFKLSARTVDDVLKSATGYTPLKSKQILTNAFKTAPSGLFFAPPVQTLLHIADIADFAFLHIIQFCIN